MIVPNESIWLPGGGELNFTELRAARAVEEYDADLLLGQRKEDGEWVVFLRHGPHSDGQPFPVMGLGHELPAPEEIKRRLYQADVRRRGVEIFNDVQRANDRIQKEADDNLRDAAGEVAEAMASHARSAGFHPSPRIFVPGKGA